MASTLMNGKTASTQDSVRDQKEVREILQDYLKRSIIVTEDFRPADAYRLSTQLTQDIFDTVSEFTKAAGEGPNITEKLAIWGGDVAGCMFTHLSPEHQRYIALYGACMGYADDLGDRNVEALAQFSRRFATGEKQLSPPLDVLADLLRKSYDLWPEMSADGIISGSLEAITAMCLEHTMTSDMTVTPQATWWPNYFRIKSGICSPFAHFNFVKGWRSSPESYMQLLPYFEFFLYGGNDVLSFYKEEIFGETANYVHLRATTDGMTPMDTLRQLVEETLACEEKITTLIGEDRELMAIWRSLEQGFLTFHIKTPRYRLADLTISGDD